MKFTWLATFLILLINATFVFSSEKDDETASCHGISSDDEDSVYDAHLNDAFESIGTDEKSYWYQSNRSQSAQITGLNGARPLSCLDGSGQEVDWWFAYKEPGGLRYLYYSSLQVDTHTSFLPLNNRFLINDPETSPVLKTIYHPNNVQPSSEVWIGWNDQPDADEEDSDKKSTTDAYGGRVCGVKHAHSKGFYAQNAVLNSQHEGTVVNIGAYAIMTSLPRFPKVYSQSPTAFGTAVRSQLPRNQRDIFDSNLNAKAQHFFCMSMPREVAQLEENRSVLEVPANFNAPHVQFLHKYLKTIHPAIMGTNYSDHRPDQALWRRYFSLFKVPASQAFQYLRYQDINVQLQAYSQNNLPSLYTYAVPLDKQRVFPLSTSQFYRAADGHVYQTNGFHSRWDSSYSAQNGCVNGTEAACLASFTFETTAFQAPLNINLFAKHGAAVLDLWDDWATLQTVESQKNALEHCFTGQVVDRYGLLVQSWIDSKTALPRKIDKKIFDENDQLAATVHIDNVSHYEMPAAHSYPIKVTTSGKDHAKWGLSFALDTFNIEDEEALTSKEYSFLPNVFVSDLNRSNTQACLKNKTQGRGGGAVAIQSASLWRALMKLHPRTPKQKFATTGKHKTRHLQNRLRRHATNAISTSSVLPLKDLRPSLFRSLRLSKKEAKIARNALKLVPVLNELKQFIRLAEHRPEHAAASAFQKLFESFADGKVEGSADKVWKRTMKKIKEIEEDRDVDEEHRASTLLEYPKFLSIPAIHLYREIPDDSRHDDEYLRRIELESQAPHIVTNKKGELETVEPVDSFILYLSKIPRSSGTQTESISSNSIETQTLGAIKTNSIETQTEALYSSIETQTETETLLSTTETQTEALEQTTDFDDVVDDDSVSNLVNLLEATRLSDEEEEKENECEKEKVDDNEEEELDNDEEADNNSEEEEDSDDEEEDSSEEDDDEEEEEEDHNSDDDD